MEMRERKSVKAEIFKVSREQSCLIKLTLTQPYDIVSVYM